MRMVRSVRAGRGTWVRARNVALVLGAMFAVMAGGGAATAATSGGPADSGGVIHGCVTTTAVHGSHQLVLQAAGASCPGGSTAVSWKQAGSGRFTGTARFARLSGRHGSPCTAGGHASTRQVNGNRLERPPDLSTAVLYPHRRLTRSASPSPAVT